MAPETTRKLELPGLRMMVHGTPAATIQTSLVDAAAPRIRRLVLALCLFAECATSRVGLCAPSRQL
jgi:hypothetical protein